MKAENALALLAVAWLSAAHPNARWVAAAGGLYLAGIVLFSGSLYALGATGTRALVLLTPMGGLLLMAGWMVLAWTAIQSKEP